MQMHYSTTMSLAALANMVPLLVLASNARHAWITICVAIVILTKTDAMLLTLDRGMSFIAFCRGLRRCDPRVLAKRRKAQENPGEFGREELPGIPANPATWNAKASHQDNMLLEGGPVRIPACLQKRNRSLDSAS